MKRSLKREKVTLKRRLLS